MHVVRWTLALAACSSEPGGSDLPTDAGPRPLGTLEVITVPAGPGTDPDGYRLELNGVVFGAMTSADTRLTHAVLGLACWSWAQPLFVR